MQFLLVVIQILWQLLRAVLRKLYGVSEELREECRKRIPGNMRKVLNQFEREIDRDCEREETTEIVFILDRSGSMAGLERDTVGDLIP